MTLTVYSKRLGHTDDYTIKKTAAGWHIDHISIRGACDKRGAPFLFENLEQDSINYPADLGGYLEFLWDEANRNGWTDPRIQPHLDALGKWVQVVQQNAPSGLFASYK